ncbi:hypothetical protein GQ55_5G196400 [Panicum hallii var. hallii]|uniref:Uncharacterized protein n=1 Tax=Panicum hallii var. hallii TaxID=1504633 RepID=A0A2T7DI28_9POAL|nr:hypothetical protein GQ55_5G196400 [Panicum hallii var. hallii]
MDRYGCVACLTAPLIKSSFGPAEVSVGWELKRAETYSYLAVSLDGPDPVLHTDSRQQEQAGDQESISTAPEVCHLEGSF